METGGIEVLHQLAEQLMRNNIETYMFYYGDHVDLTGEDPTPLEYKKYGAKIVDRYLDSEESVLIVPETKVFLKELCVKGQAVVWWLSVDGYLRSVETAKEAENFQFNGVLHFVQSCYAEHFVKDTLGAKDCNYLSDYISEVIYSYADKNRERTTRQPICFYNPKKGYDRVSRLIQKAPHINWVPICGLSAEGVAQLLCSGMVYIDFGFHPGKDRIPREAAYCGCVILTNRQGSAAYAEDVAIPEKYKVTDDETDEQIIEKITELINHYEEKKLEFAPYIEKIRHEKEVFELETLKMIEVLKEAMPLSRENIKEKQTCIEYLDMMKKQMEAVIKRNEYMQKLIQEENYHECVKCLLNENYMNINFNMEIWELARYLAE